MRVFSNGDFRSGRRCQREAPPRNLLLPRPYFAYGSDGLIELDGECWVAFAKYNLLLATGFDVVTLTIQAVFPEHGLLVIENGVLALLFATVQTYAWLSS